MFILHYLLAGALAFMGALNSFFQSSVVLFNSSVFDLVLDLPVMAAYFVVQKVSVNGISESTGICSASATEQCTWGIPGLLALRPVALPPSVLPRASKAVTLYRPEGTGLATLPTKAASSTGHESKSFDPLSSGEDVATIDLSLIPVDVLKKKTRCTRRTWSQASLRFLIWIYYALVHAAATLYVINWVKEAVNFGNFELLVDISELFPAFQANSSEEVVALAAEQPAPVAPIVTVSATQEESPVPVDQEWLCSIQASPSEISILKHLPPLETSVSFPSLQSNDQLPEFNFLVTGATEASINVADIPAAFNATMNRTEILDISSMEVANPLPEIIVNLATAPSFDNVSESSVCFDSSENLSELRSPHVSFDDSLSDLPVPSPSDLSLVSDEYDSL